MPQLPAVINCTTKAESLWRISYEFSPSPTNQAFIRHDFPRHPVGQLAACHHPTQPLLVPAESDRNSDPSTARNLDGKKIKGGTVPEHSTIDTMPYEPLPLGLKTINAPAQLDSSSTSTLPAYFLGGGEWLGGALIDLGAVFYVSETCLCLHGRVDKMTVSVRILKLFPRVSDRPLSLSRKNNNMRQNGLVLVLVFAT